MYLSRIEIDLTKRQTLRALDSPEIMHGIIEACFAGEMDRKLWRVDTLNGRTYLLLLSSEIPDLSTLAVQIGARERDWLTRDYQKLLDRIQPGSIWRFRLCANPVMSVPEPGKDRGKVKAITIAAHQREWLARQAERNGFAVAPGQFDVVRSEWRMFRNKGNNVSILSATFEGVLTVTDAEVFKRALLEGIGRGKAYGMGLLTVMAYE